MFGDFAPSLAVLLSGFAVTYTLTPLVRQLALRLGMVDVPGARRLHRQPTPRGGGLAVVLGVHVACLVALLWGRVEATGGLDPRWWLHFAVASLVLLVVGFWDDFRGLTPWVKLAGQTVAAVLMCLSDGRFGSVLGVQLPWPLDCVLVVFWLVAVINAFNLIDGLDGLASGLAIISAIGLCGMFLLGHLPGNLLVLLGLIGACLGFLRYNFHPARIFLGDTGSMFLGFTLGVVSLQTFTKSTLIISLTIPMLVLGVPIYDALLAIWRRSVRRWLAGRAGRRPGIMQPDLEHLHHRLVRAGLSTRRAATSLWALNAGLVGVGLLIITFQSHAAGLLLLVLLAAVCLLIPHLAVIELCDTGRALLIGLRRPTHQTFKALAGPAWDMGCLAGALALLMGSFETAKARFWHDWFLDLPLWTTPTMLLLALSRTYLTVWTRTHLLDVLRLLATLQVGLLLSLGVALLIDPAAALQSCRRALLLGCLSHPAILALRTFYLFIEDLAYYFRSRSRPAHDAPRVVLYGAGERCQLFLQAWGTDHPDRSDDRQIVGLIDDEPALHAQWVYGYLVLGGLENLPRLIRRHQIQGIIVTANLAPARRAALQALAQQEGISLTEWSSQERPLALPSASSA